MSKDVKSMQDIVREYPGFGHLAIYAWAGFHVEKVIVRSNTTQVIVRNHRLRVQESVNLGMGKNHIMVVDATIKAANHLAKYAEKGYKPGDAKDAVNLFVKRIEQEKANNKKQLLDGVSKEKMDRKYVSQGDFARDIVKASSKMVIPNTKISIPEVSEFKATFLDSVDIGYPKTDEFIPQFTNAELVEYMAAVTNPHFEMVAVSDATKMSWNASIEQQQGNRA